MVSHVLTLPVNIQNSGPVSLDYSSHDEAVPHQLLLFVNLHQARIDAPMQVTIEIETKPQKAQEENENSADRQTKQNKDSAGEEKNNVAESFQIPAELLE